MRTLSEPVSKLAEAFHEVLFVSDVRHRLGHHLAHVAAESWLTLEMALLFNERAADFGLPGWSALVERKRVDLILVPPNCDPLKDLPDHTIFLELKLCGTDWWNVVWRDIACDLTGTTLDGQSRPKPKAHLAVCLLYDVISPGRATRRADTSRRYQDFVSRVLSKPGEFEPVVGQQRFLLLESSPEYRLSWPRPVFSKWPSDFEANARLLWLSLPQQSPSDVS